MLVVRLTWLLKEWLYRDRSWETPCTLGSAIFLFIGMGLGFWSSIVFLTTSQVRHHLSPYFVWLNQCQPSHHPLQDYEPTPCQLTVILTVYILGIWLHHTADVQKYFVLRARKGLITDGLFSMSRNPNYLGEMFIYAAFAGKVSSSTSSSFYLFSSSQRLPGTTRCGGGLGPSSSWSGQCSSTPRGWPRTGPCRDTRSGPDTPHTQVHES